MNKSFDDLLVGGDAFIKNGIGYALANLSKIIAVLTLSMACLVTFTDIAVCGIKRETYLSMLAVMIIAAYMIYFSMLDVGEKKGEESEEYRSAIKRYEGARVKISGDMMPKLRTFCEEYSMAELEARRRMRLMSYGFCADEFAAREGTGSKRARRIFKRIERMHARPLTPRILLNSDKRNVRSELCNPERGKLIRSFLKLVPSTVCMCVTVSVVLSFKDGMTAADVINGILKLSALPIIGIRGYTAGIVYTGVSKSAWLETKARILESFIHTLNNGEN